MMKILIVDRNPKSAQLIQQTLREAGNITKHVSSKSQCFDMLKADQYDLLLTESALSDSSVLALMEELKQKGISVPVVVFIAPNDEGYAKEAIEQGAYDYIIRDLNEFYLILLPAVVEEVYQRFLTNQENIRYKNELIERNQQLSEIAVHDGLTGLYNHHQMELNLNKEFERAVRYDYPLTCLMLDIDHFKPINDTYGHAVGDFVLRELGQILVETRRRTDSCYRYGGEEFLVLMPHTLITSSLRLAERLLHRIRNHIFDVENLSLCITASMGLAAYQRGEIDTPEQLLKCADAALYQAKNAGRDRIWVWQADDAKLPNE